MSIPADRCPGVFRTHQAADGALARIRVPGGVIASEALDALALAADEFGDGTIELTVRGNLQVRGIAENDVAAFAEAVIAAGLASDSAHDRVRNVIVSPFSGRVGGLADLRPFADALVDTLVAADWSAVLSGRFWFGLDDGRGDVLARTTDVAGVAVDSDHAVVVIGGSHVIGPVPLRDLPDQMVAAARAFLDVAEGAWRISDLDEDRRTTLFSALGASAEGPLPVPRHPEPRVGWFDQTDGRVMLGAVVPFGNLSAEQARYAAAIGVHVSITTEREILIGDLDEAVAETVVRVLAPLGFIFDSRSPWTTLTACTGSPGCAKSAADVRTALRDHVADLDPDADAPPHGHWIGCDRGCGSPARSHVRVLASADGTLRRVD
ncbi:precorrin-3B synthase [Gordonia malaquae]|uniref:Precorrin-3B synthase n=1 Tax=Gordonia malaquae NBRC 108250 TaxID=1223542 RepID=M3TA96_GORML|nr:precorrin-3B synthase [Gordonia malaquae]GAC78321.1 precorrin-3B synthase [Gordonia malaquae NBRC 108250]SED31028.1 precorrin-3B synthase [Gordonia malaquae]